MGIIAKFNDALGIRTHDYFGDVEPSELIELSDFYRANPSFVRTDLISIVGEHATGHAALAEHLEKIRERFRALHTTSDFLLVRRSAWVCPNASAWSLLEDFLHERHSRDGLGSEVCLVASLHDVGCMFEPDEIAAVESGEGFRPILSRYQSKRSLAG